MVRHIESQTHFNSLKKESEYNHQYKKSKENIAHAMRQHAYFALKSNMPFEQFEKYCATTVSSGLDIGNINHSRYFIEHFLELIDKELIKMTAEWFPNQEHVTITLDVGTECGIPLLAVLFISDNKAKLADIIPIMSKKGVDLASTCHEACTLKGSLNSNELESKIAGVTGDGAFATGNAPFKKKMEELSYKKLVFRWDPLHLINRAHIEAKGEVKGVEAEVDYEVNEKEDDDDDSDQADGKKETIITELINFIQKEAKKTVPWHHLYPTTEYDIRSV